ncbi:MAG: M48 family metalloprotease [Dehalococcoidia bacterium]|nr:M48 family metalloprotease [Dehalococcoidia bacterium]
MWLQVRLYLLLGLMFALVYGFITGIATWLGFGSLVFYAVMAFILVGIQYMIGPSIVGWTMRVRYVSEKEEPELHKMVAELAQSAGIPKPKIGISALNMPNAFAFGRTRGDARVCVTQGILRLLNRDELRAVMGHEISHIKHRDMAMITLLSVVPMVMWFIAWSLMWSGRGRGNAGYTALIGIGAFFLYFVSNLMVLYASRIREYYADQGSVRMGNEPHNLATALYKLVYGNARVTKESLGQAEGLKAFFVNDPSRAWNEIRELRQVDLNLSGTIDASELLALRSKTVRVSNSQKFMELMGTHPNMLKRIKHLSTLVR